MLTAMARSRTVRVLALASLLLVGCTNPVDEYLWQASMRGNKEAMLDFLKRGADPNYVRGGWSILMRVAREGRADVAEILNWSRFSRVTSNTNASRPPDANLFGIEAAELSA